MILSDPPTAKEVEVLHTGFHERQLEVYRLREDWQREAMQGVAARREVERLRAERANLLNRNVQLSDWLDKANERTRNAETEVERLAAEHNLLHIRNSRLRKAVTWLRGAFHDTHEALWTFDKGSMESRRVTVDECGVWECQRGGVILEEDRDA